VTARYTERAAFLILKRRPACIDSRPSGLRHYRRGRRDRIRRAGRHGAWAGGRARRGAAGGDLR